MSAERTIHPHSEAKCARCGSLRKYHGQYEGQHEFVPPLPDRINRILLLVAQLLDRWDELPNDVKSDPELEQVKGVMSQISNITDSDDDEQTIPFTGKPSDYTSPFTDDNE
jgi:hypothetical protein